MSSEVFKALLEIGCGTGKHIAFLATKGYNITGIDLFAEIDQTSKVIKEIHPMRYFFLPELGEIFERAGFRVQTALAWMKTEIPPDQNAWNALMVVRK